MPGKHITEQQLRLYMKERQNHTQKVAAAKSGFSEKTAKRIDQNERSEPIKKRSRTVVDPLEPIWESIVVPLLKEHDDITPIGILSHLWTKHEDKFDPKSRRTLERRIKKWKTLHGAHQDVIFRQNKELGKQGIFDFTTPDYEVTVNGKPLKHILFHYRLSASGWSYMNVVYGGESFVAMATGLKNAFEESNGVPREIRSDRLSAAYRNKGTSKVEFTERYSAFSSHYHFTPTYNNKGIAHENGSIESPHGHAKHRIYQALLVRGSFDFESKEDFEMFIQQVTTNHNKRCKTSFEDEQKVLQPLPMYGAQHYAEEYVKVRSSSTFVLKRVTYTVPSNLIGNTLCVHVYDDKLEVYVYGEWMLTLLRLYAPPKGVAHQVDYKHLIHSLIKKPMAFRGSQLRDSMLPNNDFKLIWKHVDSNLSSDKASIYMVKLLHIASKIDREETLARFVLNSIQSSQLATIEACEELFLENVIWQEMPTIEQHTSASYQSLLSGGSHAIH